MEEGDWQDDLGWSLLNALPAMHGALGYLPEPEPTPVAAETPDPERERMKRLVDSASARLKAEVEGQSPAERTEMLRRLGIG